MDLFLPDETPGGTDASLSVAQHEDRRDPNAVQKHHDMLIAIQPNTFPFHSQRKKNIALSLMFGEKEIQKR